MKLKYNIVAIEDSPEDAVLIREAFDITGLEYELTVIRDGDLAVSFLEHTDSVPLPDLFLVDLNLPKADGLDLVRRIRSNARTQSTPLLVMSSSDSLRDRELAAAAGCDQYFWKPLDLDQFMKLGELARSLLGAS